MILVSFETGRSIASNKVVGRHGEDVQFQEELVGMNWDLLAWRKDKCNSSNVIYIFGLEIVRIPAAQERKAIVTLKFLKL